ncbi:hypothetical protein ACOKFD_06220 [Flagellimonas sp. S174]|uniref:hypothetical protein n=1 Tax=Flagellimonas sp. S174 TaxID=3410790 RepID=UPI003BF56E4C
MSFRVKSYFKFLVKSTNQHGIHSPFVFNYLTKCLYTKPKKSKDKSINVLLKSIPYFNAKSVSVQGNDAVKEELDLNFQTPFKKGSPIDILYFESALNQNPKQVFSNFQLHNDSLIVFGGIYNSKETFSHWMEFTKNEKVTVSMDLFHCGLLFIRKEQVKQHFTIRI